VHAISGAAGKPHLWAVVAASVVLLAIAVRLAWLGDDAYITLRSVENWVSGNGLRWNPGDRVQTYTHPAWMLLLAGGRWLSGEVYFTTLAISLLLSGVAIVLLLRLAGTTAAAVTIAFVLAATRAFGDYTTSGLETPLTYVLLVLLVRVVIGSEPETENERVRRYTTIVLVTALAATNRMDLAVIGAPAAVAAMRGLSWRTIVRRGALATAPFWGWLLIATFWYGSPLPVTAHAKAFGVGIPAGDLAMQGLRYLQFALTDDPVLLPVIVFGLGLGLAARTTRWLAVGALLYVAWVVKVGGDFMAGRFLLPPFVVAVAIGAVWLGQRSRLTSWLVAGVVLALAATRGVPAWLRSPATDQPPTDAELEAQWGIGDERCVYYRHLGLLSPTRMIPVFGALDAIARPNGGERWLLLNGAVGAAGFGAGARGHVLDPLLCDPLLTRLPAQDPQRWRIGHVLRRIPEGYYETLATGQNRLHHAGLRAYYEALRTLTQAPLATAERLAAWWRLGTGELDAGLRAFVAEQYYQPPRLAVAAGELPPPLPLGTYWFDEPRLRVVYDGGVAIALGRVESARQLRLQTSGFCDFRVRFLRAGTVRGEAVARPEAMPADLVGLRAVVGLRHELVDVPAAVADYDTLWIDAAVNALTHTAAGPPVLGAVASLRDPR
jgi:arabinofuranosyltransferase